MSVLEHVFVIVCANHEPARIYIYYVCMYVCFFCFLFFCNNNVCICLMYVCMYVCMYACSVCSVCNVCRYAGIYIGCRFVGFRCIKLSYTDSNVRPPPR